MVQRNWARHPNDGAYDVGDCTRSAAFHKYTELHRMPREHRHVRAADIGEFAVRESDLRVKRLKTAHSVQRIVERQNPGGSQVRGVLDDSAFRIAHLSYDQMLCPRSGQLEKLCYESESLLVQERRHHGEAVDGLLGDAFDRVLGGYKRCMR